MRFLILSIGLLSSFICMAQTDAIEGQIFDAKTKEALAFATIIIEGTQKGVSADINGKYNISLDFGAKASITLSVSYVGYNVQKVAISKGVKNYDFYLEALGVYAKEVVVSASRKSESLMQAPVAIQKVSALEIQNSSSGDFYQSLSNLSGVDIVTSSMGFKSFNTRGFNSTSPVRSVQFIDGMDNQAPGLNFPIGNLIGAMEMDLQSIEVISGAASALYGANAFQGVVNMTTKDPFRYPGLSALVKGGSNSLSEAQFRFAKKIGENNRFAYKITAGYMSATDWIADDTSLNRYGDLAIDVNLTEITSQLQHDQSLSAEDRDKYASLNTYMWFYPLAQPGEIQVNAPGYMESELGNNRVESIKASAAMYYKFSDSLQLSYMTKAGQGSAVYQGSNRYAIKNITALQHKIELQSKKLNVKAYSTLENAGDSYDLVFTGINLSKGAANNYVSEYMGEYFSTLSDLTNEFGSSPQIWAVDSAHKMAAIAAEQAWYQKGTAVYDSAYNTIINDPDLQSGSKFLDKSALHHLEGQYNTSLSLGDLIIGGAYRLYRPRSFGTIFSDTLLSSADTLSDGQPNPSAPFFDISTYEAGGYVQLTNQFFNDKLKLIVSMRADKSKNYDWQYSPRMSLVLTHNEHNFRASLQQAFRSPTLQNQYLMLDIGPIILSGNLNGVGNMYSYASVQEFRSNYDENYSIDGGLLETLTIDPVKPEQVQSFELGYRGILDDGFYLDLTAYYNIYKNFIGDVRGYKLLGDAVAGEESGLDAILTHSDDQINYQLYQFPVNARENVLSYGATVGLAYYFNRHWSAKANFTYSEMDTAALEDPIIPGFNTPKHKLNFGVEAKDIYEQWGFGFNYKWCQGFIWESPFADGFVPSYALLDAQVRYSMPEWNSALKIGASNLLNNIHIEAYGGPRVGRLFYVSWTYDLQN